LHYFERDRIAFTAPMSPHVRDAIIVYNDSISLRKKGTKAVTEAVPFQKGTLLYLKGAYWYLNVTLRYQYAPFR